MHLWRPTPPLTGPSSSRRAQGEKGSTDTAGAGGASASPATGREPGRGGSEAGASAAAAGAGGMGAAGGYDNDADAGQRGGTQTGFGPGSSGRDPDEREWHREELVVLMEAAVANPHQWDAVAHAVAGGRTPAACMRRFLTLAVEEVVEGEDKKPAAPASATEAGASVPPNEGGAFGSAANGGGGTSASGAANQSGLRGRAEQQRPAHLGPAAPALVLASALVSNVHPEVLKAAMSAAADAADAVARRSVAGVGATRDDASRGSSRVSGGGADGEGRGATAVERKRSRSRDEEEDEDIEMRDVDDAPAAAAVGSGKGDSSLRKGKDPDAITPVANGGRTESGADTSQRKAGAAGSGGGGGGPGSVVGPELGSAARAAVLSLAGLQARELAKQEERRTEALLADLLEARWGGRAVLLQGLLGAVGVESKVAPGRRGDMQVIVVLPIGSALINRAQLLNGNGRKRGVKRGGGEIGFPRRKLARTQLCTLPRCVCAEDANQNP